MFVSHGERKGKRSRVNEWLANGIIQPSLSDYASPVVLVKKKRGKQGYVSITGN